MYVYCVYPEIPKSPKHLPNCLKIATTSIVLKSASLASFDSLRQVYFTCNIDNMLVKLVGPASKLNQDIYISSHQIDEVLFWSPTKTINFFRCLCLPVKSVRSISYDLVFLS